MAKVNKVEQTYRQNKNNMPSQLIGSGAWKLDCKLFLLIPDAVILASIGGTVTWHQSLHVPTGSPLHPILLPLLLNLFSHDDNFCGFFSRYCIYYSPTQKLHHDMDMKAY